MHTLARAAARTLATLASVGIVAVSAISEAPSAQAVDHDAYLAMAVPLARSSQETFRVPASVTLAQSILESGWGASTLTTTAHNYFGIKCSSAISPYQKGCYSIASKEYFGTVVSKPVSAFRTYASAKNSFLDHGRLLTVNARYAKAFAYTATPKRFVTEVAKAGYATDPAYATKVIALMDRYNLYRYDTATVNLPASNVVITTPRAFPTVRYGERGKQVTAIQYFLRGRGYSVPTTGYYGTITRSLVRKFQHKAKLKVTGVVDPRTFAELTLNPRYGQSGNSVRAAQLLLAAKGYKQNLTGTFGAGTRDNVKAFQKKHGLVVSGIVWNATWTYLLS